MNARQEVIAKIIDITRKRKSNAAMEWLDDIPEMIKWIEERIYLSAPSLQAYINADTLEPKVHEARKVWWAKMDPGEPQRGMMVSDPAMVPAPVATSPAQVPQQRRHALSLASFPPAQQQPTVAIPGNAHMAQEVKYGTKEDSLMLIRVLMKYLEQNDASMHSLAKTVIKDCAERNKAGDAAYASLTYSMRNRLRQTVGEVYWKKAEEHLCRLLKEKSEEPGVRSDPAGTKM